MSDKKPRFGSLSDPWLSSLPINGQQYLLGVGSNYIKRLPLNTSEKNPIRVDWIGNGLTGTAGKLGMTLCPGRKDSGRTADYDRTLSIDMHRLKHHWGIDLMVPLIEGFEFRTLKIPNYFSTANHLGLETIHYPIKDGSVSRSVRQVRSLVDEIVQRLRYGQNVLCHCKAGLGRAGHITACVLVRLGYKPEDAITVVRQTRKGTIENAVQERFVHRFRGRSFP
jgi:hypothetical protein